VNNNGPHRDHGLDCGWIYRKIRKQYIEVKCAAIIVAGLALITMVKARQTAV
jgi:hypothetical protein